MLMQNKSVKKTILMLGISLHLVLAAVAFTGIVDEKAKNSKFTLNSLNKYSKKGLSLSAIKSNLNYKGLTLANNNSSLMQANTELNSLLQYNNGNTSYIYPYKIKVKVPKFKVPENRN